MHQRTLYRSPDDSLFTYEDGFNFFTFSDCDAPHVPVNLNNVSPEIPVLCGEDEFSILDGQVGVVDVKAAIISIGLQIKEDMLRAESSRLRFAPGVIPAFQAAHVKVSMEVVSPVSGLAGFALCEIFRDTLDVGACVAFLQDLKRWQKWWHCFLGDSRIDTFRYWS